MSVTLAFLLGFVALGAEVIVSRMAEAILGNTNVTVATVLGAWLAGLALGSVWIDRLAWRSPSPGRRAAEAFLAFAGAALLGALVLPRLPVFAVFLSPGGEWAPVAKFALVVPLVLLPAVAAGAAFPPLVELDAGGRRAGVAAGRIYGTEMIGSMIGASAAGFFLPRAFGLTASLGALAVVAAAVGLGLRARAPRGLDGPVANEEGEAGIGPPAAAGRCLLAIGLAGASVLALELVWTRVLLFFVPGLMSALAASLSGILIGGGAGAWIGAGIARRGGGRTAASWALAFAALAGGLSVALIPALARFAALFPGHPQGGYHAGQELVVALAVAAALAAPATAASAAAFPLLVGALSGGARRRSAVGYAASSLGSVAGVAAAAFVAGPVLSVKASIVAFSTLFLPAALVLWRRVDGWALPAVLLALAAGLPWVRSDAPLLAESVEFTKDYARERRVLDVREDAHVVASVVDLGGDRGLALYTNAFLAAGTESHYGYMRMLGHLPVLLAADPRTVLVIAYGTGTTVGSISLHPGVRRIEIAEISRAVIGLAPWFEPVNHGVPYATDAGKEVRVRYGDGRSAVERPGDPYDVITLEPLPPNTPAAVHFYTREFYEGCRRRLSPGGVLCQWIPIHTSSEREFGILLKTFAASMPATWLFLFDQCALLVGAPDAAARIDVAAVLERSRAPAVARDLERARMEDAVAVLGCFVADGDSILAAAPEVAVMTDDRPTVAFELARPSVSIREQAPGNARFLRAIASDIGPWLDTSRLSPEERSELARRLPDAVKAKRLLLDARAAPDNLAALAQRALLVSPSDLEARAFLGLAGPVVPAPPKGTEPPSRDVEAVLRAGGAESAELEQAIDRAGLDRSIDARLLLAFLDHEALAIRVRAMVALGRRVDGLQAYDPHASATARAAAIEALRRRLGG